MATADASDLPVSVVVPAYRVSDVIERQLDALVPQVVALAGEIVVVDDASPDGTGAVAARWASARPDVRCTVLRCRRRLGVNASRNAGVHRSGADLIAFADGDDVVRPGWLAALVGAAAAHTIVTGEFAWPGSTSARRVAPFYGIPLPMALGSAMLIPRVLWRAVGGFDEEVTRGGTETEFVLQACLGHGATVVTVPAAVVEYHLPPVGPGRRRRVREQQRGFAIIARRVRGIPGAPASTFTFRSRSRDAVGAVARMVVGGGGGRAASLDRFVVDLAGIGWIARMAWRRPPRRGYDPDRMAVDYEVLAGPSSNAVPRG